MKQTVVILTALMLALLMVSGFIVAGSTQQSRLLAECEQQLRQAQAEAADRKAESEKWKRETQRSTQLSAELTEQRDALNTQLNDAVLSSQEANDAVAQQVRTVEAQAQEIAQMEQAYTQLYLEYQALRQGATEAPALPTPPPVVKPARQRPVK